MVASVRLGAFGAFGAYLVCRNKYDGVLGAMRTYYAMVWENTGPWSEMMQAREKA